jgi:hypothetical protein
LSAGGVRTFEAARREDKEAAGPGAGDEQHAVLWAAMAVGEVVVVVGGVLGEHHHFRADGFCGGDDLVNRPSAVVRERRMHVQVGSIIPQRPGAGHFEPLSPQLDDRLMHGFESLGSQPFQRIRANNRAIRRDLNSDRQETDDKRSLCRRHGVLFAAAGVTNWRSNQSASTLTSS